MPQIFQVLRCYKCLVFQVHLTKKSIKWECKLCGEKQSIKRNYGIGTGKDCRVHVQKLNNLRGEIDEMKCSQMRRNVESDTNSEEETEVEALEANPKPQSLLIESKWSSYIEKPEIVEESKEPMFLGDAEVVLEIPKKQKRPFQKHLLKYSRSNYYNEPESNITQNNHSSKTVDTTSIYKQLEDSSKIIPEIKPQSVIPTECRLKEMENVKPKVPVKKFVPPVINKSSKWAQYAEDDEREVTPSPSIGPTQNDLMFSLCDDNDLDSVLDL